MALPPEVHAQALFSGPGSGPLLASARAWKSLSVEYGTAADELVRLLGTLRTAVWQGPAADAYLTVHAAYASSLQQAGAGFAAMAAAHEVAAGAYTTAEAAMPTPAELATNHATHAALVATNFFGINAVPIAVNEADYARMWIQAATTMTTYEAVAAAALASTPPALPAPHLVGTGRAAPGYEDEVKQLVNSIITWIRESPLASLLSEGHLRSLANVIAVAQGFLSAAPSELVIPVALFAVALVQFHVVLFVLMDSLPLLGPALISSVAALVATVPLGAFAGLAALAAIPIGAESIAAEPIDLPPLPATADSPIATSTPASGPSPSGPAPAGASAAGTTATTAPGAPPPAPAAGGPGPFPYLVGSTGTTRPPVRAREPSRDGTQESERNRLADSATATSSSGSKQRRRRRQAAPRAHGHEYAFADTETVPADVAIKPTASVDRAAGILGFSAAGRASGCEASGLLTLGSTDTVPLIPRTPQAGDLDVRRAPTGLGHDNHEKNQASHLPVKGRE